MPKLHVHQFIFQFSLVDNHCLAYKCEDMGQGDKPVHKWEVVAQACVCIENELWQNAEKQLKNYDSMFNSMSVSSNLNPPVQSLKR